MKSFLKAKFIRASVISFGLIVIQPRLTPAPLLRYTLYRGEASQPSSPEELRRSQKIPAIAMAVLFAVILMFYGLSDSTSRKAS